MVAGDKLIRLVDIMEKQPFDKQGGLNAVVAIKKIAKITSGERLKLRNRRRELQDILEYSDITNNDIQTEIEHLEKGIESIREMRLSVANILIEMCDLLDDSGITDHELSQIIGCAHKEIQRARKTYDSNDINFCEYALSIYGVDAEREGYLFELLVDRMRHYFIRTREGREAGQKVMDELIYKEGLKAYTVTPNGELKENYPELKLVVNNQ
ncbi:hypothetical protein [Orenia marismortui]|uniref:Uncharacterized protein n=1 Tax=Orenia marismortui TaxID=46469 RepID=A0A4R8GG09_9FIRM|nr:hypothetical protein [Orenia marismortui]TDX44590.1 hypothetical protein C7959_15014 [Orenia marismortui]